MGVFDTYRTHRAQLTARESVSTLSQMQTYFLDGRNWTQGVYQGAGNTRCLAAAAEHLRTSRLDSAKYWLLQAIAERTNGAVATIEEFNDRQDSFEEVAAVLARAKQLAVAAQAPAPVAVGKQVRLAPPSNYTPEPAQSETAEQPAYRLSLWDKMSLWAD